MITKDSSNMCDEMSQTRLVQGVYKGFTYLRIGWIMIDIESLLAIQPSPV